MAGDYRSAARLPRLTFTPASIAIPAKNNCRPVALMCRVYGVTRAGFYAWCSRGPSQRARENASLVKRIRKIHQANRSVYGSPRVYRRLQELGVPVSENRVAKLMRSSGIKACVATLCYTSPNLKKFFGSLPNQ